MNQQKRNYQKELDVYLLSCKEEGRTPRLLLHSCCAPCSSYVLEYLSPHFFITDFFYNPNITEEGEYRKRAEEMQSLIRRQPHQNPVSFYEGAYDRAAFFEMAKGMENCREGGERCLGCFRLRLFETARLAAEGLPEEGVPFDCFTTTLTISPLKNAAAINAIGEEAAREYGVPFLPCDFKKRGGFQRSIELSREYGLYRQNYCGCVFSLSH